METKLCNGCHEVKPITDFYVKKSGRRKGKLYTYCKKCNTVVNREHSHKIGAHIPMNENKECSNYLGIIIAEKALSKFYKHIKRMPINNPGYDFECDRGFKIDVKSACLSYSKDHNPKWAIAIRKNSIADYFLCLLFNNRTELEPAYVLLIPGKIINSKIGITITNTSKALNKWNKYMQPLDKVISCCNLMRQKGE